MADRTIRVRYEHGVFTPLEVVELEDGCDFTIEVPDSAEAREPDDHPDPLAEIDQYPEYVQRLLRRQATWPKELREGPRTDWSTNYRHYLYGYPKEEGQ